MALIITAAEISATLALSLNDADVEQAQSVIELASGADLGSADPGSRFTVNDLRLLRAAVLWQVAYLQAHPEALVAQPNVESFSGSGAGISFVPGVDGSLAPLAAKALARLSWRSGPVKVQTLSVGPARHRRVQPDPWSRI